LARSHPSQQAVQGWQLRFSRLSSFRSVKVNFFDSDSLWGTYFKEVFASLLTINIWLGKKRAGKAGPGTRTIFCY
jgi:hypothetical protein